MTEINGINLKNNLLKKIETLIEPIITAMGYELWGSELHGIGGKHALLRIYIDSEKGVTIDDCSRVSMQVSAVLDVEDPIARGYCLEVSSPGLDRSLFKVTQYSRYIGSLIHVVLFKPENGRRKFTGYIREVGAEKVILVVDSETIEILFDNIQKANLVS